MSERVELMGAGVRVGSTQAIVGRSEDQVILTVTDDLGGGTITLPAYAFRHLMERGALTVAEVERAAAYPADAEPLVPRRGGAAPDTNPRG